MRVTQKLDEDRTSILWKKIHSVPTCIVDGCVTPLLKYRDEQITLYCLEMYRPLAFFFLACVSNVSPLSCPAPMRLKQLLEAEMDGSRKSKVPILLPCCYDGLTARLITRSGFEATFMTGFGVSGEFESPLQLCPRQGILHVGHNFLSPDSLMFFVFFSSRNCSC